MKLHLPTALFALAVLPAVAFAEESKTGTIYDVESLITDTIQVNDGPKEIYVGDAVSKKAPLLHRDNISKIEGDLILNAGDKVTAATKITNSQTGVVSNAQTKVLFISGDLKINASSSFDLSGGSNMFFKNGVVAKNVEVSGSATPGSTNYTQFAAEAAMLQSLTVYGGDVDLHAGTDNGGSHLGAGTDYSRYLGGEMGNSGYEGWYEFSNVAISDGLKVHGGNVQIGRDPNRLNGIYLATYDMHYFQSSIGGSIEQTAGTLDLHGQTYLYADSIAQTGGTMTIATKYSAEDGVAAQYLRIGKDEMTINQNGGTLNLQGVIVKGDIINGNCGSEALKLVINQTGDGTINMETPQISYHFEKAEDREVIGSNYAGSPKTRDDYKGSYFTSEPGKESLISQSGSGTININSDYTSATFNVEQTGKGGNITIGAKGRLQSDALTLTDASTFKIQGELELNQGAELTFSINSIVSATDAEVTGMVVDGGKVTGELVSVGVIISADAMGLTSTDGLMVGTSLGDFSVVLVTGLDADDVITFAGAGVVKEATYTINGESVSVAYTVSEVGIDDGQMIATVGARVTAVGGSTPAVPEPATATLSLLALAGLCARRRRK